MAATTLPRKEKWFPPVGYKWRRQSAITFVIFHLLLPLAFVPWLFSWAGVILAVVGYYVFCSIGVDLCFHRLLSHGSYKVPKWLERSFALLGICSLQDSPLQWAATHRRHHQHADLEEDPHSPVQSVFWGHAGWMFVKETKLGRLQLHEKYVPDLMKDPFYSRIERNTLWLWTFLLHALLIFAIGFFVGWVQTETLLGGLQLGLSLFLWGVVVRVVYSWHATWAVNSIGHLWGYRNYATADNSRNNWLVTLFTNGGGWHNNHHGDQRSAAHGHHRWWEIDLVYLTLRLLVALRLAWDVIPPRFRKQNSDEAHSVKCHSHELSRPHDLQRLASRTNTVKNIK